MADKRAEIRKPLSKKERDYIVKCASRSVAKGSILIALNRNKNTFALNPDAKAAYDEGMDLLRDRVSKTIIKSDDYRDRAILANRLSLFTNKIDIKSIKSIDELKTAMSDMLIHFAKGHITSETLNTFNKGAAQLAQLYFDQNIQAELDELRDAINSKQDKSSEFE